MKHSSYSKHSLKYTNITDKRFSEAAFSRQSWLRNSLASKHERKHYFKFKHLIFMIKKNLLPALMCFHLTCLARRSALEGMFGLAAGLTGALRLPPDSIARIDESHFMMVRCDCCVQKTHFVDSFWRWMETITGRDVQSVCLQVASSPRDSCDDTKS